MGLRKRRVNQFCVNIGNQQIGFLITGMRSRTSLLTDLHEVIHA